MYLIIKCNYKTDKREILAQVEDPTSAFDIANTLDAKYKIGVGDNEVGEPGAYIEIEDENGNDKWQEVSDIACPPNGLFN